MKLQHLYLSGVLLFLAASCGSKYVINQTHDIPDAKWAYADSLRYEFSIADTLKIYDLVLKLRHGTDFRFQNLYVQIQTQFPDGQRFRKPVSLELANAAGEWQGICNANACTIEIPIQQGAYFNQAGNYAITIEQYMRESPLTAVESITLQIRETGARR